MFPRRLFATRMIHVRGGFAKGRPQWIANQAHSDSAQPLWYGQVCGFNWRALKVYKSPKSNSARSLSTRRSWTINPHEENRFGGIGRYTSAGYAEVPGELVNKLQSIAVNKGANCTALRAQQSGEFLFGERLPSPGSPNVMSTGNRAMAISGSWRGSPRCSGQASTTPVDVDQNHIKQIDRMVYCTLVVARFSSIIRSLPDRECF